MAALEAVPVDIVNAEDGRTETDLPAYKETLAVIAHERTMLRERYEAAGTDSARTAVVLEASRRLVGFAAEDVFPYWYGTRWDFNGTTEEPRHGTIACGYFVTTVLRDLGVSLARVRLAQQPSEVMIRNLVGSEVVRRYGNTSLGVFIDSVRRWGQGLYIVGLDFHVGFIVHNDSGVHFIHSSYLHPLCVVREDVERSSILASSRYRVLGKLTADTHFIVAWLNGQARSKHDVENSEH